MKEIYWQWKKNMV